MKCANCVKDAMYTYEINKSHAIHYCETHLPSFLNARKKAGLLKTTDSHAEELTSALSALSTPAATAPVEAPLVEVEKSHDRIDDIIEKTEDELKKAVKKVAPKKTAE